MNYRNFPMRPALAAAVVVLVTACASAPSQSQDVVDEVAPKQMRGGPRPGMPDLAEVAASLGVSEDALHTAMRNAGGPPPDLDKVAAELGVSVDDLKAAMPGPGPRQ